MSPVNTRPNPLVPAGAVAVIDRTLGRMRTDVCTVQRRGSTRDAGGALVSAMGTVAILDCQVTAPGRTATERVTGPRFGVEADYEIRVPRNADVRSGDQILVNGQRRLDVVYAAEPSFGFQRTVLVKVPSG